MNKKRKEPIQTESESKETEEIQQEKKYKADKPIAQESKEDDDEEEEEEDDDEEEEEEEEAKYTAPVNDARKVVINMDRINSHLVCTLCQGYVRDAQTISECLHSFCKICLHYHFVHSSNCPKCGMYLGTDPSKTARFDPTVQTIVDKLFPQYAEEDQVLRNEILEKQRKANAEDDDKRVRRTQPSKQQVAAQPKEDVTFELIPGARDGHSHHYAALAKPFIRCSSKVSVQLIKKYLAKKLSLSPDQMEIVCNDEVLGSEYNLKFIKRTRWMDSSRDLVLSYRPKTLQL
eukprot:TRINITY_DN1933_c0_g11_i1.p1 TRINITY_DN1933_c0_g11~~TRINITY_DN1933_c0_g11_i1.p1  ORF type:complete len:289 (+),score=37.12 TRINITY_DN1933_c0_g11_i1:74-940(+)